MAKYIDFEHITEADVEKLSIDELAKMSYQDLVRLQTVIGSSQEKTYEAALNRFAYPLSARGRLARELRNKMKTV